MRTRAAKQIALGDQLRLMAALDRLPQTEGVVGWRTRAFAYLLLDGALRTGAAVMLNIEDVVRDPASQRIHVLEEATMRPCEANKYRKRTFVMSDRARAGIADYLKEARTAGWLARPSRLQGPLWIASYPVGEQSRISRRTAMHSWQSFVSTVGGIDPDYQLDDLVFTGRLAFAEAAGSSPQLISEHAGITTKAAARYSDHLPTRPGSPRAVVRSLNQSKTKHRA